MDVKVRLARENEYGQIEAIMKQIHELHTQWRPDIYKAVETVLPKEQFLEHLRRSEILAAEENGEVVGMAIYVTRRIAGGSQVERKVLFVDSMGVQDGYRGQGIGRLLFDELRRIYEEGGYDGLELQVSAKNLAARRMYASYGFTEKSINLELLPGGK